MSKSITNSQDGGEEQKQIDELKKKIEKLQAERDELAIMGYMAGNMGSVYMMEAAAEASSGGYD